MINKKFYRLAYEYHERWSPCPASGDAWSMCAMDGARICADNGNDPFLVSLIKAVYFELARVYHEKR